MSTYRGIIKNLDRRIEWYDGAFTMRANEYKIEQFDWRHLVRSYALEKVKTPDLYFVHFIMLYSSVEEREFLKVANWDEIMVFMESINELNMEELRLIINHIPDEFTIIQGGTASEQNKEMLEKVREMIRREKDV